MKKLKIKFGPENAVEIFTESGEKIGGVSALSLGVAAGELPVVHLEILNPEIEGEILADYLEEEELLKQTLNS